MGTSDDTCPTLHQTKNRMVIMRYRRALFGGLVAVVIALVLSWLITSANSPIHEQMLYSRWGWIQDIWGSLNFPSYLIGALVAGNPHSVDASVAWSFFLAQWFAIGFLYVLIGKRLTKNHN